MSLNRIARIFRLGALLFLGCGLVLAIGIGCASMQRRTLKAMNDIRDKDVLVFLPGYKGSALENVDGRLVWLSAMNAIFNRRSLALDPTGQLGLPGAMPLKPVGLLEDVAVFPWFYTYHIYDQWLAKFEDFHYKHELVQFPYDWRRDNMETAQAFTQFIKELRAKGPRSISIVGHSMGGLVLAYFLRYGVQNPEHAVDTWEGARLIDRVVIMGSPFRGAPTILRDMQDGITTGLNTSLMQADAVASFPSSYQLLPMFGDDLLLTADLAPNGVDWRDLETWKREGWGLLGTAKESNRAAREKFVGQCLNRAKLLMDRLHAPPSNGPIPIPLLNVRGGGHPSLKHLVFLGGRRFSDLPEDAREARRAEVASRIFEEGDSTVMLQSSGLPEAYVSSTTKQVIVKAEHGSIFLSDEAHAAAEEFLKPR
jgi:pimeloyl-ACP methyl ester carboxylesterase